MTSKIFVYLDTVSPILLFLFSLKQSKEVWRRDFILWFILIQAFLNTIAIIYDQVLLENNLFIYHINCIASFIVLSFFFKATFKQEKISDYTKPLILIFFVFYFIDLVWGDGIGSFNSNTYGFASFILVGYCLIYYLKKLLNPVTTNIAYTRSFWYVTGIFTYFSGSFVIFLSYNYLTALEIEKLHLLWMLHNFIFLIMCIYIFIGLLCKPSPVKFKS